MLFELARALRPLTSPLTRTMRAISLLPQDVDPIVVALAIDEKLRDGRKAAGLGDNPMRLLERRAGGRIVIPASRLLRLADGRYDRARRFMHGVIANMMRQRN